MQISSMGCRSLDGHSDRAVEVDDFAVQVAVVDDVHHQAGELVRLAQPRRERHHACECLHTVRPVAPEHLFRRRYPSAVDETMQWAEVCAKIRDGGLGSHCFDRFAVEVH